ncbi:hypothetical protein [[Clostridium] colinum]|uniref:hypothetical protein n=1 Tax=[Clostridium] colinum TaxID=36835 RepID=UPI0020259DF7|nr:hypothetical protein [[Clostridium] colinum]
MKKKLFLLISGFTLCLTSNAYANNSFDKYHGDVIPLNIIKTPLEDVIHPVNPPSNRYIDYKVFNTVKSKDNAFAYSIQLRPKTYRYKNSNIKITSFDEFNLDSVKIVQGGHVGEDKEVGSDPEILYENGKLTPLGEQMIEVDSYFRYFPRSTEKYQVIDIQVKKDFKFTYLPENDPYYNADEDKLYVIFESKFEENKDSHHIISVETESNGFKDKQNIKILKSKQN